MPSIRKLLLDPVDQGHDHDAVCARSAARLDRSGAVLGGTDDRELVYPFVLEARGEGRLVGALSTRASTSFANGSASK